MPELLQKHRLNSVLYDLSNEAELFYLENGYLIIRNLFSLEECNDMLDIVYQEATEDYCALMNLDRKNEYIRNVMAAQRVRTTLKRLLQCDGVTGLMSQVLFKQIGSVYAKQKWEPHQDSSYTQGPSNGFINMLISLAGQDRRNGTVYVYAKSHKNGLYDFETQESYREGAHKNPGNKVAHPVLINYEKIDVNLNKGDAVFIHGECIHGSYENMSPERSRPMLQFGYHKKNEFFIKGANAQRLEIILEE